VKSKSFPAAALVALVATTTAAAAAAAAAATSRLARSDRGTPSSTSWLRMAGPGRSTMRCRIRCLTARSGTRSSEREDRLCTRRSRRGPDQHHHPQGRQDNQRAGS